MRISTSVILLLSLSTMALANIDYPVFKQFDPAWKSDIMGTKNLGQVGCLVSSISSILKHRHTLIDGQEASPKTLNQYLRRNRGYVGNSFSWGMLSHFNLRQVARIADVKRIRSEMDKGHYVILFVMGRHWVLATGYTSQGFSVMDPGYKTTSYPNSQVSDAVVLAPK